MKKEIQRLRPTAGRKEGKGNGTGRTLNVVIETPRGSRNKYTFDEEAGLIKLHKILPCGMSFPFDFGFVPATRGGDGDPLDVVVLMEEPVAPGCLVEAHLLGVIKARQTEKGGKPQRNDRLIAAALLENRPLEYRSIDKVGKRELREIEQFFVAYNALDHRRFEVLGTAGPGAAWKLVKQSARARRR